MMVDHWELALAYMVVAVSFLTFAGFASLLSFMLYRGWSQRKSVVRFGGIRQHRQDGFRPMGLHDDIALTALGLWEKPRGGHGRDHDDWYQVEDVTKARQVGPTRSDTFAKRAARILIFGRHP
jgi:hypothetical protein